jgi:replicative DNA helicase
VPVREILEAKEKPHLLERIENATQALTESYDQTILMAEAVKPTVPQVVGLMERMVYLKKVGCILMDHIGELSLDSNNRFDLEVGNALSAIRGVATHHGIPIVVFAHTKRTQSEDGKPRATDFANSADMERKARLALALKREMDSEELEVHVVKNTEGPSGGVVTLGFDKESGMLK